MKFVVILALYALAFYIGCKMLRGSNRGQHRLWYGLILAWCAYVHLCGITNTPHLSVSTLYRFLFQDAGRAIVQWLGG
ncbi:hypothetical protein J7E73_18000 [Paenibacillus albidus]|nr:hypothetical protein [Paenibacillus albidus]